MPGVRYFDDELGERPLARKLGGDEVKGALTLGPEIGTFMSACPDVPLTLVVPVAKNPSSIGDPSALTTRGSAFALARASL